MSRRLVDTKAGRGLYSYDGADGYGARLVWEPLPGERPLDGSPTVAPINKPVDIPLYGVPPTRSERRSQAIDEFLKSHSLRTPRGRAR